MAPAQHDTRRTAPSLDDEEGAVLLRAALDRAGYRADAVHTALAAEGDGSPSLADLPVHLRRLPRGTPLTTLVTLFLLCEPVAAGDLAAALDPLPVERLERLGLVERRGGAVVACLRLVPFGDLVLACDRSDETPGEVDVDFVAGVHAPSITLAKLAVRRRVEATLDLGTGLGVQALLAARHSTRVTAVDLNARALHFARFNAQLNGVANVEFREGSYFAPVAGEQFDLVLSNPPYVISPETAMLYRDGGLAGDAVSRGVVTEVPAYLREGGFAVVLVSWSHGATEDWWVPLERWVEGSGCDAWLLHYRSDDPLAHSSSWLQTLAGDRATHEAALDRWLAYLAEHEIEAVAYGAVVLRRRAGGTNWVRRNKLPAGGVGEAGNHIERVFAAMDYLAALPDRNALLDGRPRLVATSRIEQTLTPADGGWGVSDVTLVLTDGLGFRGSLDGPTLALLGLLDGTRTLREAIAAAAGLLGGVEPSDRLVASATAIVAELIEAGFVVPG